LSGWNLNDTLTGAAILKGAAGGAGAGAGNPVDESHLKSQNVSLIDGFAELLGLDPVATAALPVNTTVIDTTTGAEVIIGGGGSDTIKGNLGNDILDGDAWLNTRIAVTGVAGLTSIDSMNEIKARMLTGEINPGQLHIVREILQSATAATDVDTAVYNGLASEYTVVPGTGGTFIVTHNNATPFSDGVDTIRNFERLQFADMTVRIAGTNAVGTGTLVLSSLTPTEDQALTVSGTFFDANGVNLSTVTYTWEAQVQLNQWVSVGADTSFTPGDAVVGLALRVKATFIDMVGVTETVYSSVTSPVVNVNDVPVGLPVISGIATEDQILTVSAAGITDADGLGLFSYQWTRGGIAIGGATGPTLTLGDADVGAVIAVVVSYTDLHGTPEVLTSVATLPVANVNDAPTVAIALADQAATEDTAFSFAVPLTAFADVDVGDSLTYSTSVLPAWLSFDALSRTFSGTPLNGDVGSINVSVTATDLAGASVSDVFAITVGNINDAPTGTATAALAAGVEDTAYVVSATSLLAGFSDVDVGNILSVSSLTASNGGVVDNGDGTYTITPALNFNGTMALSYLVTDGLLSVGASQSYAVTAVNDATLGAVSINNLTPDLLRTLTVSNNLSDVDGAVALLGYQWESSPDASTWTVIAGATGASYTTANAGVQLRVVASYSVGGGPIETMTSAATAAVGAFHIIVGTAASETINGTSVADLISGMGGNDRINGGAGNDILNGLEGLDILDGGTGDDTMTGGTGNDVYLVDSTGDIVIEGVGGGTDRINSSVSYTLSANVETLFLTGTAAINGSGNALANTITGNAAANTLDGGAGNDTMTGGAGNDVYTVESTGDIVNEGVGEGTDRIDSSVSYALSANVETLTLTGTAAINGSGNALANTITGNAAANTLDGGAGNDILHGLDGNDTLNGGAGNDILSGGRGADILTGGSRGDRFIFSALAEMGVGAGNRDIITDFNSGDRLDFTVLDANTGTVANEAFTMINTAAFGGVAGQLRYSNVAGGITVVQGDVNGDSIADFEIQLTGTHVFVAADILL